ncbi:MAG: methyl-accepting chemotaxis protein [Thermodesulfobacteriota bacterium]|nr:methyl-accepting chemotaxis protein [Thermodesulfobacteriota bacterium]
MPKKLGITIKFISIISVATLILLTIIAFTMVITAGNSQSVQAEAFISLLKSEQGHEEKLLRNALLQKGESVTTLLAHNGAGLIIGYDFDTLGQLAKHGAKDADVTFVTFLDANGKPITKRENHDKDIKTIKKKVVFENETVGFVEIGLNFASVEKNMAAVSRRIEKLMQETEKAKTEAVKSIEYRMAIFTAVGLVLLCGIIYWTLARIIIKPVNRIVEGLNIGANQVAFSSEQISSYSQSQAEGSSEQASSIEETSSSLEEISSMTKQNADNANQADNLMNDANQSVGQANNAMDQLTTSMKDISKASEETSKIIKTIDEIAFQTNLLALNAAVEAARAGEAGAGFAVVAEEVRNLAMRSADAAKDTAELIEGTVKKVNTGSELVDKANDIFSQVAQSASKVGELVGEIAAASTEQAQGIEQVNVAVTEMDKVVQANAAGAEETASASEEMNAKAEEMKGFVGNLVTLVTGSSNGKRSYTDSAKPAKKVPSGKKAKVAQPVSEAGKALKKMVAHQANEVSPQQVIPLDDDFKDF